MRYLLLLVALTLSIYSFIDEPHRKTLLSLSADLNNCVASHNESCCTVYNELMDEAHMSGIHIDNTSNVCK